MFQIFGTVAPPPGAAAYGGSVFGGFVPFLNNILRLIFVVGGLFAFFNLILGGFGFLSAGGDAKAIEKAWGKIWQSLVGLILIVGSFVLAAIFGYLLLGNPNAILNPRLYGPTQSGSYTSVSNFNTWLSCVKTNAGNTGNCFAQQGQAFGPGTSVSAGCLSCATQFASGKFIDCSTVCP